MAKELHNLPHVSNEGGVTGQDLILIKKTVSGTPLDFRVDINTLFTGYLKESQVGTSIGQLFVLVDDGEGNAGLPVISGARLTNLNVPQASDSIEGAVKISDSLVGTEGISAGYAATPKAVSDLNALAFRKSGGELSGTITLPNNSGYLGKEALGTVRKLLHIDVADKVILGGKDNHTIIKGTSIALHNELDVEQLSLSSGILSGVALQATAMSFTPAAGITATTVQAAIVEVQNNQVDTDTQRPITSTPVDGDTTTSISSNWAFDTVKTPVPINAVFTDNNTWRGIDDTPVNGQTGESISSNWAFDHAASSTGHPRDTRNLAVGSTAADSTALAGLTSGNWARKNAAQTFTGIQTFQSRPTFQAGCLLQDNDVLAFGNSSDGEMFHNGAHQYLDINTGNFYIRDGSATRFTFDDAGHFTATGNITAYSDETLKDNIKDITGALQKVREIGGQTFDRIDCEIPRQMGVLAQAVLKRFPEAVNKDEETGLLSVNYGTLAAGAGFAAIDELAVIVESQAQELSKLSIAFDAQADEVAELKAIVQALLEK